MRATFVLLLLVTSPAHAQVGDEELARAHYLTAQSYYQQGRVREALQQFDEAYRISKRPALHYNMGICHERLGDLREAIAAYERYLAEDTGASDRAEVQAHIDQLRTRLPAPAPAAPAPVRAPPPEALVAAQPPPEKKPLVKQGWFWGVVGGGAGLVVLAVVVGVVAGTSGNDGPRTLAPVPLR